MALRIEKTWSSIWGNRVVKEKDSKDQDLSKQKQNQQQNAQQENTGDQKPADREEVQKAVDELKKTGHFASAGLSAEVVNTKDGLIVKLTQANGSVLKVMSAEEFLKLKTSAGAGDQPRGKILDQKY